VIYNTLNPMKAKSLVSGKYADGQGLWLIKRNRQAGKWVLRLTIHGKRREMGFGRWPDVSIAEARERAEDARRQLRNGVDPIAEREIARRNVRRLTVADAIDGCFKARQAELKDDGKAGRWMSPLQVHVIPKIGTYQIEDVDQHILEVVLSPIWHSKPGAAAKALNRFNLTLKHAAALGLDVDLQATMKARALMGRQRHEVTHIPSLPYQEAPEFYSWLKSKSGVSARALRFLILTIARTSEVRLATFDEIEEGIWTLPGERTKTGREHRIPLGADAVAIVEECRSLSDCDHLFPSYGSKPISDAAMSAFMNREGYHARPHGFRATFRTWVEEQTETPYEVKETALGHLVDTKTVQAYQRSDRLEKRKLLMEDWSRFLTGKSEGSTVS
jgi:integrase